MNLTWKQLSVTLLHGEGPQGESEKSRTLALFVDLVKSKGQKTTKVRVIGSEQMNAQSLGKHTIYIIEFQEGAAKELIFRRFSDLEHLEQELLQLYPE